MTQLQKAWAFEEWVQGAKEENNGNTKQKAQYEEYEIAIITYDGDMVVVLDWVGACTSTACKIDFSASFHVIPHKELFSSYTFDNYGQVQNKDTTKLATRWNIRVDMSIGCTLLLKEETRSKARFELLRKT